LHGPKCSIAAGTGHNGAGAPAFGGLQLFPAYGVVLSNEHSSVQTQLTESESAEFTTFMRDYQDMVFSTAARLVGDDAQAEDIAQEVFIRAFEHFADLRSSPMAGGWLKTVTRNLAINHLNRYRKRWRLFSELHAPGTDEGDAPEIEWEVPDAVLAGLGAEERAAVVDAALRQLPEHQRVALVLYHFEDLSYLQIAAHLRVSLAKVKTDIKRGRAALLPLLQRHGMTRDGLEA
jgi:RNA polymerase sigma-70 factor (ECF subfamily)